MKLAGLYESAPSHELYRRFLEQDRYSSTFLRTPPPRYDPIFTPLFTAAFASFGFSASVTAFLASAASAITVTAITIGIQMLLAPKPPKPEDGKVPKTQAIPYRFWGVGRVRVAGAYMLWESDGRELHTVQAIAGHRIKSVNRFWLHDDEVFIGVDGNTTQPDDERYGNNVNIAYRLGLPVETPYEKQVTAFGEQGIWTNAHRGDGTASIAMQANSTSAKKQPSKFPYGAPSLSTEADLALCWDFRDPAQSPTNPNTWEWTRNPVLQLAWHQCFNEFGHKRDYTRAIMPVLDQWKEEADVCDERVPLKGGGTEARYECNGYDTTENDPKVGTNAILATFDGWMCERGDGALLVVAGKFREKYVATITDADLVGHQIQYDVLFEDEINRIVPKFTYPEIDYATSDTDYFEDNDAILTAGRVLSQDGVYQWCHQWRQARRLGIRDWRRVLEKMSGAFDLRLSAVNSVYKRWSRMQTPLSIPRLNGKLVENRKSTLALLQGGFNMEFVKHPENIDDWNPETDEGRQPPVPPKPDLNDVVIPVINLVQSKSNGSSVYIRVDIVDPEDDSLTPVVRYRLEDDGTGNPGEWIEQEFPEPVPAGGYIKLNTNVVPSNRMLEIQVAFMTSKKTGSWSLSAHVSSSIDSTAPDAADSLTWASSIFSARAANTIAAQGRTAYLTFKMGTTAQSFTAATLINKLAAAPGDVRYVQPTPVAGATRRLWVQPENGSGVVGPTAFLDVTFP